MTLQHPLHPRDMTPFPVDLITSAADAESIDMADGERFQARQYILFRHRLQHCVALKTAAERPEQFRDAEDIEYLPHLGDRRLGLI